MGDINCLFTTPSANIFNSGSDLLKAQIEFRIRLVVSLQALTVDKEGSSRPVTAFQFT